MKTVLVILFLAMTGQAHEHQHAAHEHGHATASIAFDGKLGKFEFKSPSESIFGFEHQPKTEKDLKTEADESARFENQVASMVGFDPALKCVFKKEKLGRIGEAQTQKAQSKKSHSGQHSDFEAVFQIECVKSPLGTKLILEFAKSFTRLKDVDVQILIDSVQKSADVGQKAVTVEL